MRSVLKHPALAAAALASLLAVGAPPAFAQAGASSSGAPSGEAWRPKREDHPRPAGAIPDTTVLLRVGPEVVRVSEFITRYYAAYPEDRPATDSLGRVQFLGTLENAMILRRAALDRNRPLDFGERAIMREHTERTLSNVLYQRAIADSSQVTEAELREMYSMLKTEIHLREITFRELADAERVFDLIRSKKLTWDQAYRRYHELEKKDDLGDLGWVKRSSGESNLVNRIVRLQKGEYATPWRDLNGSHLVQCVDTRPATPAPYEAMRDRIRGIVRAPRLLARTEGMAAVLRERIGMTYDTTNIIWAAGKFEDNMSISSAGGAPVIQMSNRMPTFSMADTGRVLARHRDGRLTLSQFVASYRALPAVARPAVNTPDRMRAQVDAIALEPYRSTLARERGLERDPLAIEWIEKRREGLMVDRLYQDSVESRVVVDEAEARRHYEENRAQFITYPTVTYALWITPRKSEADSMLASLKAGGRLDTMIRADSVAGRERRGMIRLMRQNEEGTDYYVELFGGEMRPGDARTLGPDPEGKYAVLQSLEFDPGRQLSLEEAYDLVDRRVRQEQAERLLQGFLARLRRGLRIESRPDLVMRFAMSDPTI